MSKELQAMIDVLESAGRQVKRCGSKYKCLSPFSNEKTASFYLYESRKNGRWYWECFSTNTHGDAIELCMKVGGLTFPESCVSCGQEGKLSNSISKSKTHSYEISVARPRSYVKTTSRPLQFDRIEVHERTQTTFAPQAPYLRSRQLPSLLGKFIYQHIESTSLAEKFLRGCECTGGDPHNELEDGLSWVMFWYLNQESRICRVKIVPYRIVQDDRMLTGITIKRVRELKMRFVHKELGVTDSSPLLFGLPYLKPGETVYLVESEKTAELLRVLGCHSSVVAVGGTLGRGNADILFPIKERRIRLLPDMDKRKEASTLARALRRSRLDIEVVAWWEGYEAKLHDHDDIGDLVQMMTRFECTELLRKFNKLSDCPKTDTNK